MDERLTEQIQVRVLAALILACSCGVGRCASVKVEAESGVRGAGVAVGTTDGITYIYPLTTNTQYAPMTPDRVVTYSVTFPEPGTYDLYARVRVGPLAWSNDSFLFGNGFGTKSATNAAHWVLANNLASAGYTNATDVVGDDGVVGVLTWKWVNVSEFTNSGGARITFTVPEGQLTQTFQVGTREYGLWIDAFVFGTSDYTFTVAELDAGGPGTPPPPPRPRDFVNGNLVQFNDNGAWCWYQDERAVVDAIAEKLVVGSVASGAGVGGSPRNGAIEAVICDLRTRVLQRWVLSTRFGCDDHNAPAFLVRPDGKYLAIYAGHNNDMFSYWRVFDGSSWLPEQGFDWNAQIPGGCVNTVTYSNPYLLAAENRTYNFARCDDYRSPHFMVSTNYGDSWVFGGQLVTALTNVGYNSGYFRYCGNGVDRIDFICTEAHPRDVLTSIYHGYISNGMTFRTDGTVVDANIFDQVCPVAANFQLVFSNGTVMPPGMTNYRCWNSDVQRYPDGTIACIIHARINQFASGGYPDTVDPNHSFFYCRYDGTNWRATYLCQAGHKLYADEADYVGLGCLDPHDPNTIYISTRYDPRAVVPGVTDTNPPYTPCREIWKGVTTNGGLTFSWTPVTMDSVRDNCRPHMPVWDPSRKVLLWWRGKYNSAHNYDAAVVGIVESRNEIIGPMSYVDATTNNTYIAATGAPLVTGPSAGQWHERQGGNGGSILASADVVAENAPVIKTAVQLPGPGTYDLWVNFWGTHSANADWRVMAGLSTNQMQIFRQMACRIVQPGDHLMNLVLTNNQTNFLYQAYVGRVTVSNAATVDVFVDDYPVQTGTASTQVGNIARTWYDGISYARVDTLRILEAGFVAGPTPGVLLKWNSMPADRTLFGQSYAVQRTESLAPPNWITIASNIPSAGYTTSFVDTNPPVAAAFYRVVRQ
ncbi:MAG: BNR-4 repeat-containing protein [Verrucomicrobiales bacterium]|nr:BNR-4 repeat-containing protein [Verrucomicrobiales bacterium]